jgi:hypothetical protein
MRVWARCVALPTPRSPDDWLARLQQRQRVAVGHPLERGPVDARQAPLGTALDDDLSWSDPLERAGGTERIGGMGDDLGLSLDPRRMATTPDSWSCGVMGGRGGTDVILRSGARCAAPRRG